METKNVYQKLQKCRVELQEKQLKKSGKNSFANFEYFELGDFLPNINDLFSKNGLTSVFNIEDEKATLLIINTDKTDETITFTSPIAEANIKGCTPIQSLGGIHTYLRRYLYMNALEIVESDMLDGKVGNMEVEDNTTTHKTGMSNKAASVGQISAIAKMFTADNIKPVLERLGKPNVQSLSMQEASDIISGKIVFDNRM